MAKITVHKYFKPSLGKEVNHAGYTRKVKDAPERPKYKKIKDTYIVHEPSKGWYFNYGQARINFKFRKTKAEAERDMERHNKLHSSQYEKPDLGANRWTMWAWDNGAWQERFTKTSEERPANSETIKWLPYGEKPIQPNNIPIDKDNKHLYYIILDSGKPYEVHADSDKELKKILEAFYVRNKGEDYPYDAKVFNIEGREITEDQFITEMIEEILEDNED